jgi:protein phosphatase
MSTPTPALQSVALSDTGRARTANQDFAYAGPLPGAEQWELLAVADGLGGHARGEWASQRTVELLATSLAGLLGDTDPAAALAAGVAEANIAVHREASQQGAEGAATTLVAALCRGREAWWVNVGDSRLYRLSGGELQQVSHDHSWVGDQVREGLLDPGDARDHPRRNVVTRTVGFEPALTPDVGGPIRLDPGDALLLCSDGLHGPVGDDVIARTLSELEPGHAAARLVELANDAGGPDNITVVLARVAEEVALAATVPPEPAATAARRRHRRWWLAGAAAAVATGGAAGATAAVLMGVI